jgi:hypothetical protein
MTAWRLRLTWAPGTAHAQGSRSRALPPGSCSLGRLVLRVRRAPGVEDATPDLESWFRAAARYRPSSDTTCFGGIARADGQAAPSPTWAAQSFA